MEGVWEEEIGLEVNEKGELVRRAWEGRVPWKDLRTQEGDSQAWRGLS